jgi:hypothetical protein
LAETISGRVERHGGGGGGTARQRTGVWKLLSGPWESSGRVPEFGDC